MSEPNSTSFNSSNTRSGHMLRWLLLVAAALTLPTGFWVARCMMPADKPSDKPMLSTSVNGLPTVGGVPLFSTWPTDQKPLATLVLTGQTYGYLSPCGCSRPQKGGLERRANLMNLLRAKGWPVVGLDLGDAAAYRKIKDQDYLKYEYLMQALAEMGYAAVGLGMQEFDQQLIQLLSRYTLQKPDAPPIVLAANLHGFDNTGGVRSRVDEFAVPGKRPMVEAVEVVDVDLKTKATSLPIGVAAVIGQSQAEKLRNTDKSYGLLKPEEVLPGAIKELANHPKKPLVNVLLFNGTKDEAMALTKTVQGFHVIVCASDDPEPPQFPTLANDGRTLVIQVGHKGQNVGVVGVFQTEKGYELKYQLVPLGEEFLTPDGDAAAKANKTLQLLEDYTAKVKSQNLLAKFTEKPLTHQTQLLLPEANLSFIGSERCQACHPNEFKVWKDSKHSHAMEALEKYATRPSLRQFDGECVVCHSVGFGYKTGYVSKETTPQLQHVGCESCHGPGSGHAANPTDKSLLNALSPWKLNPNDKLPEKSVLERFAAMKPGDPEPVQLTAGQKRLITAISGKCSVCHDQENDPKFDLYKYMPQIWHSGFKAPANAGLPPNAK